MPAGIVPFYSLFRAANEAKIHCYLGFLFA